MKLKDDKDINVLLVEDEIGHCELIQHAFDSQGDAMRLSAVHNLKAARNILNDTTVNLVIADYRLPDGLGTELINMEGGVREYPVLMITGQGDEKMAVDAMKAGAINYVVKSELTLAQMPNIAKSVLREWDLIEGQKRSEKALQLIMEGTAKSTGVEFFNSLVQNLSQALRFRYAYVGKLIEDEGVQTISTIAVWDLEKGSYKNFSFKVGGTPCENVLNKGLCFFPERLTSLFPGDGLLARMGIESFAGIPLKGTNDKDLGILVVLGMTQKEEMFVLEPIMRIFAAHVSAELERISNQDKLKQSESKLKEQKKILEQKKDLISLLQKVAIASNEALKIDDAMRVCLEEICQFTEWPVGHVYFPSEENKNRLYPSNIWNMKDTEKFRTFKDVTMITPFEIGEGLPGRVLKTKKPAWITDVTKDPNFARGKLADHIGVKAAFGFPILAGKEVVAVLEFFTEKAIMPDKALLDVMSQIGTQLGRVAERKKAEKALLNSENKFRSLVQNIPGVVYRCANDKNWTMQYISDNIQDLTGYPPSDFINNKVRTFTSIFYKEDINLMLSVKIVPN